MTDDAKRAAGEAAAALVEKGMLVGLGTGSTMRHAIVALARRNLGITAIPTSAATATLARSLRIRLAAPDRPIDLAIDGADEIELGTLRLIKGLGGALLREKIVAERSRRFVVVADDSKLVTRLGERAPLPVEISDFGHAAIAHRIAELGGKPALRLRDNNRPFRTDGGNFIVDCTGFAPIRDPFTLQLRLRAIAGVLGTGLFLMPVEQAIVGAADGSVRVIRP